MLKWFESGQSMVSFGVLRHKVWKAHITSDGFYAKSGMDVHGPYGTASEARKECSAAESKEPKDG